MRVIEPENNTVILSGPPRGLRPEKLDVARTEEMLFMLDSWIDETDQRKFWVLGWAVIALRIFAGTWKRASREADEGDLPFEITPSREEGRWIGGKIRWVFGDALLNLPFQSGFSEESQLFPVHDFNELVDETIKHQIEDLEQDAQELTWEVKELRTCQERDHKMIDHYRNEAQGLDGLVAELRLTIVEKDAYIEKISW